MPASRTAARAAVMAWFASPAVPGLNTVFVLEPATGFPDAAYFAGTVPGTQSGAIAVVHILHSTETRKEMRGGQPGGKRIDYEIALELTQMSSQQKTEDAMNDFDVLWDAVTARLRSDPTLGASAGAWQAGEGQLDGEFSDPKITEKWTEIWCVLKFQLTQWT